MSHPALWRLLIHDPGRGDGDPKFVLAVVPGPGDVRPTGPIVDGVDDVTARWVADRHGAAHAQFTPCHTPLCGASMTGESHGDAQAPPAGSRVEAMPSAPSLKAWGRGAALVPLGSQPRSGIRIRVACSALIGRKILPVPSPIAGPRGANVRARRRAGGSGSRP